MVEITGLRNPYVQLNGVGKGLIQRLVDRAEDGSLIRKAGAMAIVKRGGEFVLVNLIHIVLPIEPHIPLEEIRTATRWLFRNEASWPEGSATRPGGAVHHSTLQPRPLRIRHFRSGPRTLSIRSSDTLYSLTRCC